MFHSYQSGSFHTLHGYIQDIDHRLTSHISVPLSMSLLPFLPLPAPPLLIPLLFTSFSSSLPSSFHILPSLPPPSLPTLLILTPLLPVLSPLHNLQLMLTNTQRTRPRNSILYRHWPLIWILAFSTWPWDGRVDCGVCF